MFWLADWKLNQLVDWSAVLESWWLWYGLGKGSEKRVSWFLPGNTRRGFQIILINKRKQFTYLNTRSGWLGHGLIMISHRIRIHALVTYFWRQCPHRRIVNNARQPTDRRRHTYWYLIGYNLYSRLLCILVSLWCRISLTYFNKYPWDRTYTPNYYAFMWFCGTEYHWHVSTTSVRYYTH